MNLTTLIRACSVCTLLSSASLLTWAQVGDDNPPPDRPRAERPGRDQGQDPLRGPGRFQGPPGFQGQGRFQGQAPFQGPGRFQGQAPFQRRGGFQGQGPFRAGPRFQGQGGPLFPFLQSLSPEQRRSFRESFQDAQARSREVNARLQEARERLQNTIWEERINEEAVRERTREVARLEAELILIRAHAVAKVRPRLSPEQMEQLRNLRGLTGPRWEGRFGPGGPEGVPGQFREGPGPRQERNVERPRARAAERDRMRNEVPPEARERRRAPEQAEPVPQGRRAPRDQARPREQGDETDQAPARRPSPPRREERQEQDNDRDDPAR